MAAPRPHTVERPGWPAPASRGVSARADRPRRASPTGVAMGTAWALDRGL